MDSQGREYRRLVGWLVFSAFATGAVHSLVSYTSGEFYELWLYWIRHPGWPLANPWILFGTQVVALMGLLVGWRSAALRRAMYYFAFWTSFVGFWSFFRIENLLVPFGISLVLMILTLVDLKKDMLSRRSQ